MPSRRVLLRTIGAGLLASTAGCSALDRSVGEAGETSGPATTTEYQETTIMSTTTSTTTRVAAGTETGTADVEGGDAEGTTTTTTTTGDEHGSLADDEEPSTDRTGDQSGGAGFSSSPENAQSPERSTEPTGTPAATTTTEPPSDPTTTTEPSSDPTATTESPGEPTTISTEPPSDPTTTTTEQPEDPTTTTAEEPTTTTTSEEPPTTTEQPPAGPGSWSARAALPAPQSNAGGGVVDGKLYFFGGIESGADLPAVARTFVFDPTDGADGSWQRLEDMPRALWAPCGVAAEGNLFSFGGAPENAPYGTGDPPSDEIFVYTPGEGWRDLTAETGVRCPYPNWAMGGAYNPDDGLVYLVGGGTNVTDRESASNHGAGDGPGTYDESRIWTFDPATEQVANPDLARMPEARRWPTVAFAAVDGERYLHAICGLFGVTGPTNDNLRYRLSAGEWETATPAPRSGIYATNSDPVIDGTLYLTHGLFWEGSPSVDDYAAVCDAYDPAADSFRTGLARPARLRGGAVDAVIDGTLYVVGGHVKRYDQNGFHDCKAHAEAFTPPDA